MSAEEANASAMSRRHLMQLQMVHQNLKVLALEVQMAEGQTVLSDKQQQTPGSAALAVSNEEVMELQSHIKDLKAELEREKFDRECLQMDLDKLHERRATERQELCDAAGSEDIFQETLEKIVDECVRQKQARKTAKSVAKGWLLLVRSKQPEPDPQALELAQRQEELAQRQEELNQAKKEKALQEAFLEEFHIEMTTVRRELAQKEEELIQANLEVARTKALQDAVRRELAQKEEELIQANLEVARTNALQDAVVEECKYEVMTMQQRISDLQLSLQQATIDNQAGTGSLEKKIEELMQQLNQEKDLRKALQKKLSVMELNSAVDADLRNLKEQLVRAKHSCQKLQKDVDIIPAPSAVESGNLTNGKNIVDVKSASEPEDANRFGSKVDESALSTVAQAPPYASCGNPLSERCTTPPNPKPSDHEAHLPLTASARVLPSRQVASVLPAQVKTRDTLSPQPRDPRLLLPSRRSAAQVGLVVADQLAPGAARRSLTPVRVRVATQTANTAKASQALFRSASPKGAVRRDDVQVHPREVSRRREFLI